VEFFVVELMIVVLMIDACLVHTNTNSFHDMLYYLIVVHFIILNIMAFVKFRNYHLIPFHSSFIVSFQQIQQITKIKQYDLDQYTGPIQPPAPLFAGFMTGATYYMRAGPRVAALAGTIGMSAVGATFGLYSVLGLPYGSKGWLWF
jgi:hypothetical protein